MKEILASSILIIGLSWLCYRTTRKKSQRLSLGTTMAFAVIFMITSFGVANYDSIQRLHLEAKATSLELERFQQNVDTIADKGVTELQKEIAVQKQEVKRLGEEANRTKEETQKIYQNVSALALLLTKITWLQVETKNEFGGKRDDTARQQITNELNNVLFGIIPDEKKRTEWINAMYKLLPKE